MIRLDFPTEPYWLDLPLGVRVQGRPLTGLIMRRAQYSALRRQGEVLAEVGGQDDPPIARKVLYEQLLAEELARFGVVAWEGVEHTAGKAMDCTPEAVADLFSKLWQLSGPFIQAYLAEVQSRIDEGNGSRPAPGGTSGAGQTTADGAESSTSPVPGASPGL